MARARRSLALPFAAVPLAMAVKLSAHAASLDGALPPASGVQDHGIAAYLARWADRAREVRLSQPEWSSPLVTTTALLEQRLRFDAAFQHAGNGADTAVLDGGKGLDLIVGRTEELQVGSVPYDVRSGSGRFTGFGDWPFVRFKQRLASSPASAGNYVLSAWLQVQAPTGAMAVTNHAWTLLPTLGFGKGWGAFDVQGTVGAVIPTAHEGTAGTQVVSNTAFQYRLLGVLWPQVEVNWTYFPDGRRGGKHQVFLTPGLVVGRFPLAPRVNLTVGAGYQSAITPTYRASPATPVYDHAWILTSRVSF